MNDSDPSDDDNWDEDELWETEVDCLFCSSTFNTVENALLHCYEIHNISLAVLKTKFSMDCYSFIKLVNYIRQSGVSPAELLALNSPIWDDDKYLKPTKEADSWLMFDFEEYFEHKSAMFVDSNGETSDAKDEQLSQLQFQLKQKEQQVLDLTSQLFQMKEFVHKMLEDDGPTNDPNRVPNSDSYFESYSGTGIHHDMLSDEVRTTSYKNAIMENSSLFSGKKVLDLGCGTGILSMFAASAGAQKVYAVDNSDIVVLTFDIIRENNLLDKIEVIKSKIENENSSIEPVDIIISEWMGYFLLFEGMLDSLIYARDRYLKPDGVLLPDLCNLYICGAYDDEGYDKYVGFWSNVYGYRMSCVQNETLREAMIDVVPSSKIITSAAKISSFDLRTCTVADTEFKSTFELSCHENSRINAFVGYFDTIFNLENCVQFSTSPFSPSTHWKQTVFYLKNSISCEKGETIKGSLTCSRSTESSRSLIVTIRINEEDYVYNVR